MMKRRLQQEQITREELQLAGILLDPVAFAAAFMRDLDGDDPQAPLCLWPHQQEEIRDTHPLIVHQDGRSVGKTVNIGTRVIHRGVTVMNNRMLVTTPNEGHLQKIISEVEDPIYGNDFLLSQIATDSKGHQLITKKPYYEIRWKNGSITYFRPAGPKGKSVRSLHVKEILVDEAAWYPELAWGALRRCLNKGGQMRIYTNPNGLRKTTYYRLTTDPKAGAKVYHWPSWIVPGWKEDDTAREAEFYGGRDTAGFQHEVAGEHGAPSFTTFNHRQLHNSQRELKNVYGVIRIDGEEFAAISSVDEAIGRLEELVELDRVEKGRYWFGADLGYTNDPSEMTVWLDDDNDRFVPVLRVHNSRLPYTYQAALIAMLDDFFDFEGLGIDAGSNGRSVEQILTTEDRYEDHQFAYRLEAYDFGSSITVGYDTEGRPKTRNVKEFMTSLINGRLATRKILTPNAEVDIDWEDQFLTHTYSHTTSGRVLYSKGNDHIIDSTRVAVLRKERERLKEHVLNDDGQVEAEFVMPVLTNKIFD
ncbi:MAG: hypothetical protein V2A34_07215 [Lentisphaerota bacterium]